MSSNLTRWTITQSKVFTRKGIEKISISVRAYVCLVLTSQVQARSSIAGNSTSAVDAQQVFQSTFKALINEDYSISAYTDRYQGVLEHAKLDFPVDTGIYMLLSFLNIGLGKTVGYNNKILKSSTDMKICSKKNTNKDHKKLPLIPRELGRAEDTTPKMYKSIKDHEQTDNQGMLAEKYNDEKLAITILVLGAGLIAYHFWKAFIPPAQHEQCVTFVIQDGVRKVTCG